MKLMETKTIERNWGRYTVIDSGSGYVVKRLELEAGKSISLQYHNHRAEHWTVVAGVASVIKGSVNFELRSNQSTYIEKGTVHQLSNNTKESLVIIEVQTGNYIDESDIVRLAKSTFVSPLAIVEAS